VRDVRGTTVALAGFPYERHNVRVRLPELLEQSGWERERAALRLLCLHHCVEGATVGPGDFTFTTARDVIRHRDVPAEFAAVLSGHIHRHQVLATDLRGQPLRTPVLYPGSLERTSSAEIGEPKGYLLVHLSNGGEGTRVRWEFRRVPARPMLRRELGAGGASAAQLEASIRAIIDASPRDAVLTIRVTGALTAPHLRRLSARHLRTFAPDTMNLEVRCDAFSSSVRAAPRSRDGARPVGAEGVAGRLGAEGGARSVGAEGGAGRLGAEVQLEVAFD
jgi:DNA repair exonuclease SbcCD nuclease subunit